MSGQQHYINAEFHKLCMYNEGPVALDERELFTVAPAVNSLNCALDRQLHYSANRRIVGTPRRILHTTYFIMLNVSRLDTAREGRNWAPQPIWTVASWLQERKKRFPVVAHRAQNEGRLKSEAQEQEQDFKEKKEELGFVANGPSGQVKQEYSAEDQSKATQLIQQIREAKRLKVAESSTMPRKEASRGVSSTEEEIDAKLEETMDLSVFRNGTPADHTSQIIATPRKPKTPRSKKCKAPHTYSTLPS